jgi:hypothetical protein
VFAFGPDVSAEADGLPRAEAMMPLRDVPFLRVKRRTAPAAWAGEGMKLREAVRYGSHTMPRKGKRPGCCAQI